MMMKNMYAVLTAFFLALLPMGAAAPVSAQDQPVGD